MDREKAIVVARYSNEAHAQMAQMSLESMGIESYLLKDDVGGTYPSLQVASGIRLLVAPSDVSKAKETLLEIESEQMAENKKSKISSKYQGWSPFFVGMLLGAFLATIVLMALSRDQETMQGVVEYDTNADGKADMRYSYRQGVLLDIQEDRNSDGRADSWQYYESERISRSEVDDNFDGKIDGWAKYRDRYNYSVEFDIDFDGVPDASYLFENGIKREIDWFLGGSQVPARREVFEHGVKTKELIDANNDGSFDLAISYDPFGNEVKRETVNTE